ncbi:MAG: 50S ribosomal protein L4, partial [Chloroflexi bacterium]|nr:50S ribosomal protein L4 [Chloroflexota bacterium]
MPEPRTKEVSALLERLDIRDESVLVLLPEPSDNFELSARNLPFIKTLRANCLSVRDLLRYDRIVMTRGAVEMIHGLLGTTHRA